MSAVRIGNIILSHGLMLAPMAGVTNRCFRRLCAAYGAEYAVTEMISAKALCYEKLSRNSAPARSAELAILDENTIPTAVQLFGSEPEFMAKAAEMVSDGSFRGASGAKPAAIDLNMGCPVRKVVACGEGSALMRTPELAARITEAVVGASSLPVTVKIRSGWNNSSINAAEFAEMLESAGAAAVCVHGRTREQFYAPSADYSVIAAVKSAVNIPVIGNGDICTAADARRMFDETGCDGVMVARGALGNPWIFSEIIAMLDQKPFSPPSPEEKIDVALKQAGVMLADGANPAALRGMLGWFIKGIPNAAQARGRLNSAGSLSEMESVLLELKKSL